MKKIMDWIIPREDRFFDMLEEQAERIIESSSELNKFIHNLGKIDNEQRNEYSKKLKDIEKEGDVLTHSTVDALNKIFITPIDREDIHKLIILLDDFLDLVKDVGNKLALFKIEKPTEELIALNDIVSKCGVEVSHLIRCLRDMKGIEKHVKIINALEEEADKLHHETLAELFKDGNDPLYVIKFSDLYQELEEITDKSKEISNVVWNTGVKHA